MKKGLIIAGLTLIPALAAVALYGKPVERAGAIKDKVLDRAMTALIKTQAEKILEKAETRS